MPECGLTSPDLQAPQRNALHGSALFLEKGSPLGLEALIEVVKNVLLPTGQGWSALPKQPAFSVYHNAQPFSSSFDEVKRVDFLHSPSPLPCSQGFSFLFR